MGLEPSCAQVKHRKMSPIPIPLKPKEGALTSNRYPEHMIKPLPKRTKKPRP